MSSSLRRWVLDDSAGVVLDARKVVEKIIIMKTISTRNFVEPTQLCTTATVLVSKTADDRTAVSPRKRAYYYYGRWRLNPLL